MEYLRKWEDEKSIAPIWRKINEEGSRSEAPQHRVRIAQPFFLATCEVTQGRFEQVMKYNRSFFGPTGEGRDQVDNRARSDLPVESVTFAEALEFCQKLGEQEGLSGATSRGAYRLPTDAEWEYACRAGTTTPFWFGFPADVKLMARCDETTPVRIARLKANPFGLYDMHGKVWELCEDFFSAEDFARFEGGIAESPTGPAGGRAHVARGGSYSVGSMMCRSASRIPVSRPVPVVGFRPALAVETVRGKMSPTGTTMSLGSVALDVGSPEAKELFKVGRALCFVEDDWQKGIPLLAKGSHAGIRAAAQSELANPTNAEQQAELGKLWYSAAATAEDPDNWHCYRRARFWLTKALAAGSSESNSAWYQAAQKQMDILPTLKTALRIKARTFNHEIITIRRNHIEWVSRDGAGPQQITNSQTGAALPPFHCKYGIRDVHTFEAEKVRTILPEAVDFTTARLRLNSKSGPTSAWIRAFIDAKNSDASKVTVVVAEWDQKKNGIANYKGDFEFDVVLNFGLTN